MFIPINEIMATWKTRCRKVGLVLLTYHWIQRCHEKLDSGREERFPLGAIYSIYPEGSPSPSSLRASALPPSDTLFFQQLLALLLCSPHRCAVLFWTPCPWTFPTHNFPNQSLAIKMSLRDGENCGGSIFKRRRRKRCFARIVICVDFFNKG